MNTHDVFGPKSLEMTDSLVCSKSNLTPARKLDVSDEGSLGTELTVGGKMDEASRRSIIAGMTSVTLQS